MCSEIRSDLGSFLEQIVPTEDEPRPKKKKTTSTTKKTEKPKGCKDIRNFFQNAGWPGSNKDSTRTTVIDWKIYLMYFLWKIEERNSILTLKNFFVKFPRGLNFANFGHIRENREI